MSKAFSAILLLTVGLTSAGDWPQFRGPERNGQSRERDVLSAWPEGGPAKVLWRAQVGRGHSAVSVAGGQAYTLGWDGQRETVWCFDAVIICRAFSPVESAFISVH